MATDPPAEMPEDGLPIAMVPVYPSDVTAFSSDDAAVAQLRDRLDEMERRERFAADAADRRRRDYLAIWASSGLGLLVTAVLLFAEQRDWVQSRSLELGSWAMAIALAGAGVSAIVQSWMYVAARRRLRSVPGADRSRVPLAAE